jgi:hypothetical protein
MKKHELMQKIKDYIKCRYAVSRHKISQIHSEITLSIKNDSVERVQFNYSSRFTLCKSKKQANQILKEMIIEDILKETLTKIQIIQMLTAIKEYKINLSQERLRKIYTNLSTIYIRELNQYIDNANTNFSRLIQKDIKAIEAAGLNPVHFRDLIGIYFEPNFKIIQSPLNIKVHFIEEKSWIAKCLNYPDIIFSGETKDEAIKAVFIHLFDHHMNIFNIKIEEVDRWQMKKKINQPR